MVQFADRTDAGHRLAMRLLDEQLSADVVLGLPRGGLPVAAPVAHRLAAELAALVVRKIGAPGRSELAIGAVAEIAGDLRTYRNDALIQQLGVPPLIFDRARRAAVAELREHLDAYGGTPEVAGRAVIVVDDGLATGATMLAAVDGLTRRDPATVTVAVPVASTAAVAAVRAAGAGVIALSVPADFRAVGYAYADFGQTTEREVRRILQQR